MRRNQGFASRAPYRPAGAMGAPVRRRGSWAGVFDVGVLIAAIIAASIMYVMTLGESFALPLLCVVLYLNALVAAVGLFLAMGKSAPLFVVTFFFNFVFFGLAPLQQIADGWRVILAEPEATATVATLCVLFNLAGLAALAMRTNPRAPVPRGVWGRSVLAIPRPRLVKGLKRLLLVVGPLTLVFIALYNVHLFTTREDFTNRFSSLFPRELAITVLAMIHPFVFIGAFVGLCVAWRLKSRELMIIFGIVFAMTALIYSPLVAARFRSSAMIAFVLMMIVGWNRARILFVFLAAGVFAAPALNAFRYAAGNASAEFSEVRPLRQFFVGMDFDAFTMTCYIIKYVQEFSVDFGNSALSAFLYVVPRAIWSGKSDHVPKLIYDFLAFEAGTNIDNLSSPPIAEGYFAFAFPGAILAIVLFYLLIYKIEQWAANAEFLSPSQMLACVVPMYVLILLRGALVVGVSEMSGAMMALVGVLLLLGALKAAPATAPSHQRNGPRRPPVGPGRYAPVPARHPASAPVAGPASTHHPVAD
ncbi:hypothetical protein [Ancylobacter terrae]|uniref:hypothetical protein n=1 Tax=Ancylobacter sp. sgz301288 TaxID=3342077 RepID=UPI003859C524